VRFKKAECSVRLWLAPVAAKNVAKNSRPVTVKKVAHFAVAYPALWDFGLPPVPTQRSPLLMISLTVAERLAAPKLRGGRNFGAASQRGPLLGRSDPQADPQKGIVNAVSGPTESPALAI
jgi:hypothetical protein